MKSKQQKRSEARNRFRILSHEEWTVQQTNKNRVADVMGYNAYVARKNAELENL